jgi:hypothetical protein
MQCTTSWLNMLRIPERGGVRDKKVTHMKSKVNFMFKRNHFSRTICMVNVRKNDQ